MADKKLKKAKKAANRVEKNKKVGSTYPLSGSKLEEIQKKAAERKGAKNITEEHIK